MIALQETQNHLAIYRLVLYFYNGISKYASISLYTFPNCTNILIGDRVYDVDMGILIFGRYINLRQHLSVVIGIN